VPSKGETWRDHLASAVVGDGAPSSDYDLNPDIRLPEGRRLRDAAVLIGVMDTESGPRVLLTKRSSRLKHHPGQVAFPGGKVDDDDATLAATALREAEEEVALPPSQVEVLGSLAPHETVTGFSVTPVVALIHGSVNLVPQPSEVDEAFTVPLALVTDPARFTIERRRWRGQWRSFYTVPHGPYYIWGATARMLRQLSDRMPS